jgi:hypothetical protein
MAEDSSRQRLVTEDNAWYDGVVVGTTMVVVVVVTVVVLVLMPAKEMKIDL